MTKVMLFTTWPELSAAHKKGGFLCPNIHKKVTIWLEIDYLCYDDDDDDNENDAKDGRRGLMRWTMSCQR